MEKEKVLSFMKQYWKMDDFIRNRFEEYMDYCKLIDLFEVPEDYCIDYWVLNDTETTNFHGSKYSRSFHYYDISYSIPTSYFWDENWKEDVDKKLIEKKRKAEEKKQAELLYRASKEEEEERKLYETLKKKYE